jgi:hypothetical protein
VQPEGYYGGALHLNVGKPARGIGSGGSDPAGQLLDALLFGAVTQAGGEERQQKTGSPALALLDTLLAPQEGAQEGGTAPGRGTAAPSAVTSAQRAPGGLGGGPEAIPKPPGNMISKVAGAINPIGSASAAELPPLFRGAARPFRPEPGAPHGRFDPGKIGTGEGFHGEGHGAYVSESERVAGWYRDAYGEYPPEVIDSAKKALAEQYPAGSRSSSTEGWSHHFTGTPEDYGAFLKKTGLDPADPGDWVKAALQRSDFETGQPGGAMYEARLPGADTDEFLRWDLPLAKQSDYVKSRLRRLGINHDTPISWDFPEKTQPASEVPGQALYHHLADRYGTPDLAGDMYPSGDPKAAAVLRLVGVRGTRYPADERNAGAFNYSIFDPQSLEIIKRYGIAGLMGGGAATAAGAASASEGGPRGDRTAPEQLLDALLGGGDPEAAGAAATSRAMEPAATEYVKQTPQRVLGGIEDVNRAFRERDTEALVGAFGGPGAATKGRAVDLLTFLRGKGGLKPDPGGELRGMDLHKGRGFARVIRPDGLDLDMAREAAAEAGYLRPDADINDFLEALRQSAQGRPVYPPERVPEIREREARARQRDMEKQGLIEKPTPGAAPAGDPFDPGSMFDNRPAAGGAGGKPPKPPSGPPGEPPTMQPPPGSPQQARRGAEAAADAIRDLFWTKGWRERKAGRDTAKAILREQVGTARQRKAQAVAALENFRAQSSAMVPDFERWIGEVHAGREGPPPAAMQLINHVEGRGYLQKGDPLRPLADELRKVYQRTRDHIDSDVADWDSFVENYFRHLWKEGAAGEPPGWGAWKAGSSASLKQRSIPTIEEGIRQGWTPAILDPTENTLHYVSGMQDYLAFHRAREAGLRSGYVSAERGRTATGESWPQLKARGGEQFYAEPGFAKIWNYHYGKGWIGDSVYDKALHAANTVTAFKLGLSGYHAWNILQEGAVAGLANAIGRIPRGEFLAGMREMGYSAAIAPKVAEQIERGGRLQGVYLDLQTGSNMDHALMDLFARAGGRAVGRGQEYRATAMDNFWQSWQRGKLGMELKTGARRVLGDAATEPLGRRVALGAPRAAGLIAQEMSRLMQTITAPVFDKMIPRIKLSAWADEMEAYLVRHPNAGDAETMAEARRLVDTIDDRFGEMVQDNLFWHPALRQIFNLTATSIGWEFGSLRAFGGAAKDIMSGKPFSPRARWLISFPVIAGLSGAAYQYLRTGKTPGQDDGGVLSPGGAMDLAFPRSGGVTPEGAPERALLPGYEKDPIQWFKQMQSAYDYAKDGDMENAVASGIQGTGDWIIGRRNAAWQLEEGLRTGKDFFGRQIRDSFYGPFRGYAGYVLQAFTPIPLSQETYRGSQIGQAERFSGIRPAPEFIEDPARFNLNALKGRLAELKKEYWQHYTHGRRTGMDPKELDRQGAIIKQEMDRVAAKLRTASQSYRETPRQPPPTRPARPSVVGP